MNLKQNNSFNLFIGFNLIYFSFSFLLQLCCFFYYLSSFFIFNVCFYYLLIHFLLIHIFYLFFPSKQLTNFIFFLQYLKSSNGIGDQGASGLGSGLANCTHLSNLTLQLSGNKIGAKGASGLGSALANCTNLSNLTLYLSSKFIDKSQQLKVKSKCLKSKKLIVIKISFY
ncbi:transmembrane protein, putative (macronuclear) [Tetrahymena thermophila SB210]|uniref:Transmembrane protein, putative n=1 Tax=Tetrahymena thermophila (strain SB210) TaxID=312017 RepID=W7X876_TETTS|nr:transmembrane protein, putative [Tetrahymena thermophila SB210]EWS75580.1 transmembrane protein, putative [Tetrahymena thermophila SB210]|eukprot:XP_012651880.1 transmembrane protein, putative [Tetrahymena thermophila SB210]